MKLSQTILSGFIVMTAMSALASASQPEDSQRETVLSCQESNGNALVTEKPQQLVIERDSSGQLLMTLTEQTTATESRVLMNSWPVTEEHCNGYQPCRYFSSEMAEFFINFYPNLDYQPGHLQSGMKGAEVSTYFHCQVK